MLLHRITKHVTDQNWFAVFIDFLIVVVGVFIGIQVANWNTERGELKQERDYLIRLHEDIAESITNQTRDINFLNLQLADQAIALKSLDACVIEPSDSEVFQRAINMLGFINFPRFSRRTVDEMAASGQTDILQNISIQATLAKIVAQIEWRASAVDTIFGSIESRRLIVDNYVRYNLNLSYTDEFIGEFAAVSFDITAMCADPKVANSISNISFHTRERRNAYQPIIESFMAFNEMIEIELKERWGYETIKKDNK
jgi:hypothetical protein